MNVENYFCYLDAGDFEKAENERVITIPERLIKFFWINEDDSDIKKYETLEKDEVWFSNKKYLNDPFEFQGMFVNKARLLEKGCTEELVKQLQTIFDFDDYGITCFSANPINYLPMWAYYTNNHKGYCVEYEVINKACVHEVLYLHNRIKVASSIIESQEYAKRAILTGDREKIDIYMKIFLQNLFIKAKSWEHEKEYRIVAPIWNSDGKNIPVNNIGLKTKRIVAGINSSNTTIQKLNDISNKLGIGNVYICKPHPEEYGLMIEQFKEKT